MHPPATPTDGAVGVDGGNVLDGGGHAGTMRWPSPRAPAAVRRRLPARKGNVSTSPQPPSPAGTSPNKLTSTSSDARSHTRCLPLNRAGDVVLRVKFARGACCRTLALEIGKLPSPAGIAHDKHRYTSPSVVYKLLPNRRPRSRSRTVSCCSRMNARCSSQETSVLLSGTK